MLNPQNLTNGNEQHEIYNAPGRGSKPGPKRCQYDYRHTDGVLFSCTAKSLEDARARRDKWVKALRNMTDNEYALKRENGSFLCPRCHSSSGIEENEPLDWSNPSIDSEYAVIRLSCPCGCRWTEILRPVGYELKE
jgi:hypothetical protein